MKPSHISSVTLEMEDTPAPSKSGDLIEVVPLYAFWVDTDQVPAPPVLHGIDGNAASSKLSGLGSSGAHGISAETVRGVIRVVSVELVLLEVGASTMVVAL